MRQTPGAKQRVVEFGRKRVCDIASDDAEERLDRTGPVRLVDLEEVRQRELPGRRASLD